MVTIRSITSMCKNGQLNEALRLALDNYIENSSDVWAQRALGWALYYVMKNDVENNDFEHLLAQLDKLNTLELLTVENDGVIFDQVLFQIASFIKNNISTEAIESLAKLSAFFDKLKGYAFGPSKGHSFLLSSCIKFENWSEMIDFLDWWNLENLLHDDYKPFVNNAGQKIMSLAERAYIAKSKALMKQNELGRIEEFLPKLEDLMDKHPEMMYPGYFYGKLLIKLGADTEESLKVIVPFVRKKVKDFWAWQLLGDVFVHDDEKQLACLLRAVNCHTDEKFLGKIRMTLASWYIQHNQYDRAKYNIDISARTYTQNGWRLPIELRTWTEKEWFNNASPNNTSPINYMGITDDILCNGTEEAIAVVSYVDPISRRSTLIYGKLKKMSEKLRGNFGIGSILKINYIVNGEGNAKILYARSAPFQNNLDYVKVVEGTIMRNEESNFATLSTSAVGGCFVSPKIVEQYGVNNHEQVKALVVYDFNKKKDKWNWVCISIKR